jgi:MFS family permease
VGLAALMAGLSFYLFSAALPLYLHVSLHYSLRLVGLLIGVASIVQLVATVLVGPFVDRRGARLAMQLGAACYLLGAVLFLLVVSLPGVVLARVLQGVGLALILPSIFTVVPAIVVSRLRGTALGLVGAFNNVALAVGPPVGLLLIRRGPSLLFGTAIAAAMAGFLLSSLLRVGRAAEQPDRLWSYRLEWTPLYAITFIAVVYWGVVTAFLAIEVPSNQLTNVGWFFTADAIAVLAARVPAGYLADRFGPRWLLVIGSLSTALAIGILTLTPSFITLMLAGIGTGVSAALLFPPILLELSKRSTDANRGTAMALYNTSFAAAVGAGSVGGALLVPRVGFRPTLYACLVLTLAVVPVAIATLHRREDR